MTQLKYTYSLCRFEGHIQKVYDLSGGYGRKFEHVEPSFWNRRCANAKGGISYCLIMCLLTYDIIPIMPS